MCAFSILIVKRANSISRILSSKRVETGKKKSITSYLCDLKWRRWGRCFLSLGAIKCHLDNMITQTTGELNDSLEDLKRSLDRNLLAKENWHHLFYTTKCSIGLEQGRENKWDFHSCIKRSRRTPPRLSFYRESALRGCTEATMTCVVGCKTLG